MADGRRKIFSLDDSSDPAPDPPAHWAGRPWALWLLVTSWPRLLTLVAAGHVFLVAMFACGYLCIGDSPGAAARLVAMSDAFFLSAQVFMRVNLGAQVPQGGAAQFLVVCEMLAGWLVSLTFLALSAARFMRFRLVVLEGPAAQERMDLRQSARSELRRSMKRTGGLSN